MGTYQIQRKDEEKEATNEEVFEENKQKSTVSFIG